jgi:GNAT superfamily N-acetyltransferase
MSLIRLAEVSDSAAIARVHIDTWRTTYTGIVPAEHLAGLSYERCQARWIPYLSDPQGETRTFVLEARNRRAAQIVAFASGGPARDPLPGFDAELYNLYVLKAFQGNGHGRLLVTQLARDLASRGYGSLITWVLEDNPACRFYERLGGRLAGEKVVEVGGKELVDVAYVWPDLAALTSARAPSKGSPEDPVGA